MGLHLVVYSCEMVLMIQRLGLTQFVYSGMEMWLRSHNTGQRSKLGAAFITMLTHERMQHTHIIGGRA
jgi:hypothetical protein